MKVEKKFIALSICFGLFLWVVDAVLDFYFFSEGTFWELLIYGVSKHEVYIRSVILVSFIIFGIIITSTIAKRKKVEETLHRTHSDLEQIFNAAVPLCAIDKEYNMLRVNDTFCSYFHLKKENVIGKKCYDILRGSFCDKLEGAMTQIIMGKPRYEYEVNRKLYDGTKTSCIVTATPYISSGGELLGVIENITDISMRKQHEQEREKLYHVEKERIKQLRCLYGVTESVWRLESLREILHHTVQLIPPGWRYPDIARVRIVYDGEEFVSKPFEESGWRLSSEFVVRDKLGFVEVFYTEKRPAEDEGPFLKEERNCLDSIAQILGEAAEKELARNEKAQLEEKLRLEQKMESAGRLAGGMAHSYNNALSVIIGYTELAIMADQDSTGPMRTNLGEVLSAARRATDMTRQLLAFARKQIITPMVLDLNETVESMLTMLRRIIGEDMDLNWLPGGGLWSVNMDPAQIEQIMTSVCLNARDAIEGVGKVTIETGNATFEEAYYADHTEFVPGEFVLLVVSDDGCGMEKDILHRIFEPFFTTKEVDKGTGLGLSTVYGIVKQNNGFINAYSEPGKGTSIKIYLPRYEGKVVQIKEESTAEIPASRGETILLVEDDLPMLKLAKKMLDGLGYTVLTAGTQGEAMNRAEEHIGEIDLVVADVVMPEINGRELAEHLQSLYPDLKAMFMSGYTANVVAHHGVLDEEVQFIQKPFSKKDLAATVREALDE